MERFSSLVLFMYDVSHSWKKCSKPMAAYSADFENTRSLNADPIPLTDEETV